MNMKTAINKASLPFEKIVSSVFTSGYLKKFAIEA